jgi:hypothetical protein
LYLPLDKLMERSSGTSIGAPGSRSYEAERPELNTQLQPSTLRDDRRTREVR